MTSELDRVASEKASSRRWIIWGFGGLDYEWASEVAPTICRATSTALEMGLVRLNVLITYKIIALAIERCVYPAMLDETVVSETVKPTDWALTSQKQTSLPHVFERGR